jgi:hypothetical protein
MRCARPSRDGWARWATTGRERTSWARGRCAVGDVLPGAVTARILVIHPERGTLSDVAGHLMFTAPKTKGSAAGVGLSTQVVAALQRQAVERAEWAECYQDDDLVFARVNGAPLRPDWVLKRFHDLTERAGATPSGRHRSDHQLRDRRHRSWRLQVLALHPGRPARRSNDCASATAPPDRLPRSPTGSGYPRHPCCAVWKRPPRASAPCTTRTNNSATHSPQHSETARPPTYVGELHDRDTPKRSTTKTIRPG